MSIEQLMKEKDIKGTFGSQKEDAIIGAMTKNIDSTIT